MRKGWRTAVHEAAHALVALCGGVLPARIVRRENGGGLVQADHSRLCPEDRCLMALAGAVAEQQFVDDDDRDLSQPSGPDWGIFNEAREAMGVDQYDRKFLPAAMTRAEQFVLTHERQIKALASHLMRRKNMTADDTRAFIHAETAMFGFRSTFAKPSTKPARRQPAGLVAMKGEMTSREKMLQQRPDMRATVNQMIDKGMLR